MPMPMLHTLIQNGQNAIDIDACLSRMPEININERDDNGNTALHIAVQNNQPEIVSLLLQRGVDCKIRNNAHYTPKKFAKEFGRWDIVERIEQELRAKEQKMQQAISFLYDKMKDAHKVAFRTQDGVESSQRLPIPDGFSEQDCSFFTMKFLEYYGADTARQFSEFKTDPDFQLTNARATPPLSYCHRDGSYSYATRGGYAILASKPIITEQEITQKKLEYKLI